MCVCVCQCVSERVGGMERGEDRWREGWRRGLILPGLRDKLVPGSRKRGRKPRHPSNSASIRRCICDQQPHGFVSEVGGAGRIFFFLEVKECQERSEVCVLLRHRAAESRAAAEVVPNGQLDYFIQPNTFKERKQRMSEADDGR